MRFFWRTRESTQTMIEKRHLYFSVFFSLFAIWWHAKVNYFLKIIMWKKGWWVSVPIIAYNFEQKPHFLPLLRRKRTQSWKTSELRPFFLFVTFWCEVHAWEIKTHAAQLEPYRSLISLCWSDCRTNCRKKSSTVIACTLCHTTTLLGSYV